VLEAPSQELLFTLEAFNLYSGEVLDLTLDIVKVDGGFEYRIEQAEIVYTGNAELVWDNDLSLQTIQLIRLAGIPWIQIPGGMSDPVVEILNTENGFLLQNYGNAMNIYQVIRWITNIFFSIQVLLNKIKI